MSTGVAHFQEAQSLLIQSTLTKEDRGYLVAKAQVHATLAVAAATALTTTSRMVGDSAEITHWAKKIQPSVFVTVPEVDSDTLWPPRRGDLWADNIGRVWQAVMFEHPQTRTPRNPAERTVYLVCLDEFGDDSPDEIRRTHGPMQLLYRPELLQDILLQDIEMLF